MYWKGTSKYCLYFGEDNIDMRGYMDSDHGDDRDNNRSTTKYIFTISRTRVSYRKLLFYLQQKPSM